MSIGIGFQTPSAAEIHWAEGFRRLEGEGLRLVDGLAASV